VEQVDATRAAADADVSPARRNRVKACFREGRIALNTYVGLADPALMEIIGIAGFDAATIDLEHMTYHLELVREMIVAAEVIGVAPIIRVAPGEWTTALQALDAGAQGIQVTHVRDARTAREAVSAVRYPPQGERGALGISRAARYGATPWDSYVEWANEEILLTVMIEDEEALGKVEEIASVEGVDLVTVGVHDLAESLGIRKANDQRLRAIVVDVAERIRGLGRARMGFSVGHPVLAMSVSELMEIGVSYINVLPPPEVRLRIMLSELVDDLRKEARV